MLRLTLGPYDRRMPSLNSACDGRTIHTDELDRWLMDALRMRVGDTVLELAAGTEGLSARLAGRVRPGGTIICSDREPHRVAEAIRLFAERGAGDVSARVIDMVHVDLPEESVDGVICRWGYMFALPQEAAFEETFRVLRPGRPIALSVWGDSHRNPWMSFVNDAFAAEGHAVRAHDSEPGEIFSLAEADTLRALLIGAGFEEIVLQEIPVELEYIDSDAHWNEEACFPNGPFTSYLATLESEQVSALRARLDADLSPFRLPSGGYLIPGLTLNATARRPDRVA
jgi:SAM-dependent methyltransferase